MERTASLTDTLRMTSLVMMHWVFSLPTEEVPIAEPSESVRMERRMKSKFSPPRERNQS